MLNIQADLRAKLAEAFEPDVNVSVNVPEVRPDKLITVRRGGGAWLNRLQDQAGVNIYCWAKTEADAQQLADDVAHFMQNLTFAQGYELVEMEGMYSDSDLESKSPRWFISYTITTHEVKN